MSWNEESQRGEWSGGDPPTSHSKDLFRPHFLGSTAPAADSAAPTHDMQPFQPATPAPFNPYGYQPRHYGSSTGAGIPSTSGKTLPSSARQIPTYANNPLDFPPIQSSKPTQKYGYAPPPDAVYVNRSMPPLSSGYSSVESSMVAMSDSIQTDQPVVADSQIVILPESQPGPNTTQEGPPPSGTTATPTQPPHHGKNPPSKKKRARGRPPGSTNKSRGASRSTGGESRRTSTGSGKSRQRSKGGGNSVASNSSQTHQSGPTFHIVSDDAPDRIVNPLIEIPSEASQSDPIHSSELLTITELIFHKPDTYPLSYLGRLLGFDLPVPNAETAEQSPKDYRFPTPFPDVNQLQFMKRSPQDDVFFQIPPAGPPFRNFLLQQQSSHHKIGDRDDLATLHQIDPVYSYLLQHGFDKTLCKPGTSTLVAKMTAPLKSLQATREKVTELAVSLGVVDTSTPWTFTDWASTNNSYSGSISSNNISTSTPLRYPEWTLEDGKVATSPPSQSFGVVACYQQCPIAVLHYKFQWYPMVAANESELVMVMEGFGKRTGTVKVQRKEIAEPPNEESGSLQPSSQQDSSHTTTNVKEVLPITQDKPSPPETEPINIPSVDLDNNVRLLMIAFALEHARAVDVWYCLWNAPEDLVNLNRNCFRMTTLPATDATSTASSGVPMICDLKKCSSRYALLKQKESSEQRNTTEKPIVAPSKERLLIKLPTIEDAKCAFDPKFAESQRSKRTTNKSAAASVFTGATGKARTVTVHVKATLPDDTDDDSEKVQISALEGEVEKVIQLEQDVDGLSPLDILRWFPVPSTSPDEADDNEILNELKAKQQELCESETALEPRLRDLMKRIIEERQEFESPEQRQRIVEEKLILQRNEQNAARRKKLDEAWQEQLEQDMNAVCNICNDGEVTPDNQILFCEACNVPVHQMCYGIDTVPEGDYYCIACRYFGREKMIQELAKRGDGSSPRVPLPPLPISCELCPIKKGAYIRTAMPANSPNSGVPKWVHMACAKWQGLNFIEKDKPDVVEDVTELKRGFRRLDFSCAICQGKRGAYQQCRHEGCNLWMHMTCARAIGVCEVIHGEDVEGPVSVNPWTLMCPKHSNIDPDTLEREPASIEQLVNLAKEFPEEPIPEPPPVALKQFNKLNGKERRLALAKPEFEREFLDDLMTKRFSGLRCEVCCMVEEDGKNLARCTSCETVVCFSCRFSDEEFSPEQKYFTCFACRFVQEKTRNGEPFQTPQCHLCNQKQGLLLSSFARPVNRLGYWKNNEKEYNKTIFAQTLWTHYACAFWLKGLEVDGAKCQVDCSNVVMSNGRGYIRANSKCALCGLSTGLKARCADTNCRARGERRLGYALHISCARQAGYEVQHEDDHDPPFYVHCYFHGGCEYNLRARLEDLIEIEKRRAGKRLARADAPMSFADASRLLNHAIVVMGILGWAWRWAEHWVEHGSNWEPLLEPGEMEEMMTKKQLKIVDSTPESRADDARKCRLEAFGAALRNRAYDTEAGFDHNSLKQALTAVLSTKSLVGPLRDVEIEFFTDWLSRAYRSKSKVMGLGEDKIKVASDGCCVHTLDKSPKYELGNRPLPGKAPLEPHEVFEPKVDEPDDFLLPEILSDGTKSTFPPNSLTFVPKKVINYKDSTNSDDEETESGEFQNMAPPQQSIDATRSSHKKKLPKTPKETPIAMTGTSRSLTDSVLAVAPSAVKKRRHDRSSTSKEWFLLEDNLPLRKSVPTAKRRKTSVGYPGLETRIEYAYLVAQVSEDSVLRRLGRRGRPPKWLDFETYIVVNGKHFRSDTTQDGGDRKMTKEELAGASEVLEQEIPIGPEMQETSSLLEQSNGEQHVTEGTGAGGANLPIEGELPPAHCDIENVMGKLSPSHGKDRTETMGTDEQMIVQPSPNDANFEPPKENIEKDTPSQSMGNGRKEAVDSERKIHEEGMRKVQDKQWLQNEPRLQESTSEDPGKLALEVKELPMEAEEAIQPKLEETEVKEMDGKEPAVDEAEVKYSETSGVDIKPEPNVEGSERKETENGKLEEEAASESTETKRKGQEMEESGKAVLHNIKEENVPTPIERPKDEALESSGTQAGSGKVSGRSIEMTESEQSTEVPELKVASRERLDTTGTTVDAQCEDSKPSEPEDKSESVKTEVEDANKPAGINELEDQRRDLDDIARGSYDRPIRRQGKSYSSDAKTRKRKLSESSAAQKDFESTTKIEEANDTTLVNVESSSANISERPRRKPMDGLDTASTGLSKTSDDGLRRSGRHSLARAMSLKEPNDSFGEDESSSEEEATKNSRSRRSPSKQTKGLPLKKRRR